MYVCMYVCMYYGIGQCAHLHCLVFFVDLEAQRSDRVLRRAEPTVRHRANLIGLGQVSSGQVMSG